MQTWGSVRVDVAVGLEYVCWYLSKVTVCVKKQLTLKYVCKFEGILLLTKAVGVKHWLNHGPGTDQHW